MEITVSTDIEPRNLLASFTLGGGFWEAPNPLLLNAADPIIFGAPLPPRLRLSHEATLRGCASLALFDGRLVGHVMNGWAQRGDAAGGEVTVTIEKCPAWLGPNPDGRPTAGWDSPDWRAFVQCVVNHYRNRLGIVRLRLEIFNEPDRYSVRTVADILAGWRATASAGRDIWAALPLVGIAFGEEAATGTQADPRPGGEALATTWLRDAAAADLKPCAITHHAFGTYGVEQAAMAPAYFAARMAEAGWSEAEIADCPVELNEWNNLTPGGSTNILALGAARAFRTMLAMGGRKNNPQHIIETGNNNPFDGLTDYRGGLCNGPMYPKFQAWRLAWRLLGTELRQCSSDTAGVSAMAGVDAAGRLLIAIGSEVTGPIGVTVPGAPHRAIALAARTATLPTYSGVIGNELTLSGMTGNPATFLAKCASLNAARNNLVDNSAVTVALSGNRIPIDMGGPGVALLTVN